MTRHADAKTAKIDKTAQIGPEPPRRRRATKRELARRDLRLVEQLAAGVTIEEIAANKGISLKWAKERKAAALARRAIDPPHEFMQLQIRRLSEAMLVAYSSMSDGNVKAIDQVIRIVRELDRYHGFAPHPESRRFAAPVPVAPPLALPEPPAAEPAMGWAESEPCDDGAPRDPVAD